MPWSKFSAIFITGTILIIIGFGIIWYTQSTIFNIETTLKLDNLSQNAKWALEGSLSWWKTSKVQTYEPLSNIFTITGMLILLYSVAYLIFSIFTIKRDNKTNMEKPTNVISYKTETNNSPTVKVIKKTGFPIASGILTIIGACILLILGLYLILVGMSNHSIANIFNTYVVVGILDTIGFAFGLTSGVLNFKRKMLPLTITGIGLVISLSIEVCTINFLSLAC